jgi:hypothetical protein
VSYDSSENSGESHFFLLIATTCFATLIATMCFTIVLRAHVAHVVIYVGIVLAIGTAISWPRVKQVSLIVAIFIPLFLVMLVSLAADIPRQLAGLYDGHQAYLASPARKAKLGRRSIRQLSGRSWI